MNSDKPPTISPGLPLRLLGRVLTGLFIAVVLAGLIAELVTYLWIGDRNGPTMFFSLSYERNLPTWYSASLLLGCAILLGAIAIAQRARNATHIAYWWVLAAIFAYISLDETTSIHENLNGTFQTRGVLFYDWIIIAAIILVALWIGIYRFITHLDHSVRVRFLIAGGIYVSGALLMELPLGWWTDEYGIHTLGYGFIDLAEESMEILGLSLFLYFLARFLGERVTWRVAEADFKEVREENPAPEVEAISPASASA